MQVNTASQESIRCDWCPTCVADLQARPVDGVVASVSVEADRLWRERYVRGALVLCPLYDDPLQSCPLRDRERRKAAVQQLQSVGFGPHLVRGSWEWLAEYQPVVSGIVGRYVEQQRDKRFTDAAGLILLGPVGTGKSITAGLIAIEAVVAGASVAFCRYKDLLDVRAYDTAGAYALRLYRHARLLVIDDFAGSFGAIDSRGVTLELFERLMMARYDAQLPTIITTNATGSELRELAARSEWARLFDRWRETQTLVTVAGSSHRRAVPLD